MQGFLDYPTTILPSGTISLRLTFCWAASVKPKETGPTLPMNMVRVRAILPTQLVTAVTPLDTPTVAKADTASKAASTPGSPFCSSGQVRMRMIAVMPETTIPKNRMASER